MELLKEPIDVDFVVDPRPLTDKERKLISDFIKNDKLKSAKKSKTLKNAQKRKTSIKKRVKQKE
ncbi:MAG: hypothetical protein O9302_01530 [Cyclobacteriaceae bacterium]|jgi:hypothetical protein|nr:hypothetical protein [Flammeovirgaceae bacterium]MCZ8023070.1 hypothetical protein [Cytophagales bacterium]MCZ8326712.1 hypothetical protein [Cyclobacteriaceae bacterium]